MTTEIEIMNSNIKKLKKELSELECARDLLVTATQNRCKHPIDKIVDEGGMFGSVCICTLCNKVIQHSGGC